MIPISGTSLFKYFTDKLGLRRQSISLAAIAQILPGSKSRASFDGKKVFLPNPAKQFPEKVPLAEMHAEF